MMSTMGLSEQTLEARGALWTAREIAQQPAMLRKTDALVRAARPELNAFLEPILAQADARIIFCGAGTSAFIGDCLAAEIGQSTGRCVRAIATTDIVSAPRLYLDPAKPTLLVSFARSGDSPESLATVALADQLVDNVRHLIITCNGDGRLAAYARTAANAHLLLLPEETHDRGFAMTSSFSCMMYAALAVLGGQELAESRIDAIADAVEGVVADYAQLTHRIAARGFARVVYLGGHGFLGLVREAALKMLEMTDGAVVTLYDSPLGFRHGPKAIVNAETLVVLFLSNDRHSRRYDLDLLAELKADRIAGDILVVSAQPIPDWPSDKLVAVRSLAGAQDHDLLFAYVAVAQMIAFHQSLALNKTPDNPNPTGAINRVVQGVQIHAIV